MNHITSQHKAGWEKTIPFQHMKPQKMPAREENIFQKQLLPERKKNYILESNQENTY